MIMKMLKNLIVWQFATPLEKLYVLKLTVMSVSEVKGEVNFV